MPVRTIGDPGTVSDLTLNKRPNGRFSIARQNYLEENSERHPAWAPEYGWPRDASAATSTESAKSLLESLNGVHLYLVRTTAGEYFAGMTVGNVMPPEWPDFCRPLFEGDR